MARPTAAPTGRERMFGEDEIIVSKTDLQGQNHLCQLCFPEGCRLCGGRRSRPAAQHDPPSRHAARRLQAPLGNDRGRQGNFRLRQEHGAGRRSLLGLRPCDAQLRIPRGAITGYHSFRRWARRDAIAAAQGLYDRMIEIETNTADRRRAWRLRRRCSIKVLEQKGCDYDTFVLSL